MKHLNLDASATYALAVRCPTFEQFHTVISAIYSLSTTVDKWLASHPAPADKDAEIARLKAQLEQTQARLDRLMYSRPADKISAKVAKQTPVPDGDVMTAEQFQAFYRDHPGQVRIKA